MKFHGKMKKRLLDLKFYALSMGAIALTFTACQDNETDEELLIQQEFLVENSYSVIPGQYVVTLNSGSVSKPSNAKGSVSYSKSVETLKGQLVSDFGKVNLTQENLVRAYAHSVEGFTAILNDEQIGLLRKDPRVKHIEQDYLVVLAKPGSGGGSTAPQEVPYGITRVGGGTTTTTNTAWIIDSGIDLDHPDLNVDVARSMSFVRDDSPNDQNGHGSHVAGTVAAIDNEIGVIGVAPGATVVAVRVLDRRGSGSYSGVIAGVDYVAANGSNGDAANMSLGGPVSQALDDAVVAAAATGVKFSLAAGNETDDANNHSPARANGNNVYTVSAMDINDNWASFSNYGNPPNDYCAPGVQVYSTYKDGGYATLSGTSMAAPHVCGLLLLGNVTTDGFVNGDPDGNPDPIAHR